MVRLRRLIDGLRRLFSRTRIEDELNAELAHFLEAAVDGKARAGLSGQVAIREARLELGSTAAVQDRVRDIGWESTLDGIWRDLRYAVRSLRRAPGFTVVVVFTLALGIGANTAIFGLLQTYLWKDLAVYRPGDLVALRWAGENTFRQQSNEYAYIANRQDPTVGGTFPIGFFERIRGGNPVLSQVAGVASAGSINLLADGQADSVRGELVSGEYFPLLGITAVRGRMIQPEDDRQSAEPIVALSHAYWSRRFAQDPAVVGRSVAINGVSVTVVGITASDVGDLAARGVVSAPEVWIPLALEPRLRGDGSLTRIPAAWWLTVIGRLVHGATLSQVEASVTAHLNDTVSDYGSRLMAADQLSRLRAPRVVAISARRGLSDPNPIIFFRFRLLAAICAIVLVIVCLNVANLMLSRAVMREREVAVRTAIGATRARVIQQLLIEAMALGTTGALAAAAVASVAARTLAPALLGATLDQSVVMTWPTLTFVGIVSLLAVVIFGLFPALHAIRKPIGPGLHERAGTASRSQRWTGTVLLTAQVALAIPLLIGAGLFLRTLINLRNVDVGFDAEHLVLFTVEPELNGYDSRRSAALYPTIADRLRRVPGVSAVTTSAFGATLLDGGGVVMMLAPKQRASMFSVGDNFFSTLGISVIRGRTFTSSDTRTSTPVAVINEAFARAMIADREPIGHKFSQGASQLDVIGVVADAKVNGIREPAPPTFYRSITQRPLPSRRVVVRTTANAAGLIQPIRDVMRDIDPQLPLQNVSTQRERIDARYLVNERIFAVTSNAVGGLALLVTMIGAYGLLSYSVAQRTREIGIRMALGAQRHRILWLTIGETIRWTGVGILAGLGVAAVMASAVESVMFGLSSRDPLTTSMAAVLMLLVTVAAGYVPARRATRVDPLVALRCD